MNKIILFYKLMILLILKSIRLFIFIQSKKIFLEEEILKANKTTKIILIMTP